MRRNRRGHSSGMEFGGSGEDSFVAVVVTKLTGALLFILLLTMVIMALLPKVVDLPSSPGEKGTGEVDKLKLTITTPEALPEGIAGRPYQVAMAADGGRGHLNWSVIGTLPDGLTFDPQHGLILGSALKGTTEPIALALSVSDGFSSASKSAKLVIYQPDTPLSTPSKWKPAIPPIPWKEWLNQGVGFLVLWLVHLLGVNTLNGMKYRALDEAIDGDESRSVGRRFMVYKIVLSVMSIAATATLATWLWWPRH